MKGISESRMGDIHTLFLNQRTCSFCVQVADRAWLRKLMVHVLVSSVLLALCSTCEAASPPGFSRSGSRSRHEPCSPPEIDDIEFNQTLTGRVVSSEVVVSELHCMDKCLRSPSCIAYNLEFMSSSLRCTTLATIDGLDNRARSAFRSFKRPVIEKFLLGQEYCKHKPENAHKPQVPQ